MTEPLTREDEAVDDLLLDADIAGRVARLIEALKAGMQADIAIQVAIVNAYYDGRKAGISSMRDKWLRAVRS